MKNAILAFVSVLIFIACGGLVFYILYGDDVSKDTSDFSMASAVGFDSSEENKWIYKIAKNRKLSYVYPTNEFSLKFNFDDSYMEQSNLLKLAVENLDEYKFFCINQVLTTNNVDFAYYRVGNSIQVLIFLGNRDIQEAILDGFAYYEIEYRVQS